MPCAMSAPTVASAVVIRTAASVVLGCFVLLMMSELVQIDAALSRPPGSTMREQSLHLIPETATNGRMPRAETGKEVPSTLLNSTRCAVSTAGDMQVAVLDKRARTCAFPRGIEGLSDRHASLSHPYLRRAARKRHRQKGAAFRLVPPDPRSRRRAVHRPARPLRHHASGGRSRFARLQDGRDTTLGMGGADQRQGAPVPRRH